MMSSETIKQWVKSSQPRRGRSLTGLPLHDSSVRDARGTFTHLDGWGRQDD